MGLNVIAWLEAQHPERKKFLNENKWALVEAIAEAAYKEGQRSPLQDSDVQEDVDFDENAEPALPTVMDYKELQRQYDTLQTQLKQSQDEVKELRQNEMKSRIAWLLESTTPKFAKAGCIGDFVITKEKAGTCPTCYEDGQDDECETCGGVADESGHYNIEVVVPWDMTKDIWKTMNRFAAEQLEEEMTAQQAAVSK